MMKEYGKSDSSIIHGKLSNKACKKAAEAMEESGLAKGNTFRQNAYRTRCRNHAQSAFKRVRGAAKGDRKLRFTALFHHVYSIEMLCTAYYGVKRKVAAGIDRW
ncbi:MAG: hypothetical protein JRE23_06340 [Deltaproteobacteria bacterium]|nr:hypothetical protein [Deltaproteobacteria bacterium]